MEITVECSLSLMVALKQYARNQSRQSQIKWDKQKDLDSIYNAAKEQFGDKLVYFESFAANKHFYLRMHGTESKPIIFETVPLLEKENEYDGFRILKFCEWANKL